MRRTLLAIVVLGVVAAVALLAWRWLASAPAPLPAPRPPEAAKEPPPPPPPAPPPPTIQAERGAEALPPPPLSRTAALDAARNGALELVRRPVELSVVDRATRQPLRDVELRFASLRLPDDAGPIDDGPDRASFARGDSPLTIPASASESAVSAILVRAPGHATAKTLLDFRTGGRREVALEASCELDLMVDAPPGKERFGFELRRLDDVLKSMERRADVAEEQARRVGRTPSSMSRAQRLAVEQIGKLRGDLAKNEDALGRLVALERPSWARAAAREEWTKFDRLVPGDWVATLVTDRRRSAPLDAVVLHLEAGAVERRKLTPRDVTDLPAHAVHGTIVLPSAWSRDEETSAPRRLLLDRALYRGGQPADAQHRVVEQFAAAGPSRFTFDAGELATGLWIARLPQFGVIQEFEVVEAGPNDLTIEVGAPCDVDLALVEARTKQPVKFGQLTVSTGEGDAGGEAKRIAADAGDGHFRFRAPVGRLHVRADAFDASLFVLERAFDLVPGRNDLVFALEQVGRVHPRLSDGGAGVPWSGDFHVELAPASGSGGLLGWHDDGTGAELLVAPAGKYTIRIGDLPGFEPVGPIEFEVAAGGRVDLPIALVRSK